MGEGLNGCFWADIARLAKRFGSGAATNFVIKGKDHA